MGAPALAAAWQSVLGRTMPALPCPLHSGPCTNRLPALSFLAPAMQGLNQGALVDVLAACMLVVRHVARTGSSGLPSVEEVEAALPK